jgi:protein-tyrosine phosphatase
MTSVYWIPTSEPGRLGIMPRPRGNDWLKAEIKSLADQKVDILISALSDYEINELGLHEEAAMCNKHKIEFRAFPISDRTAPLLVDRGAELVKTIYAEMSEGKSVVIHCRLGIGRSGMLCAGTLIAGGENAARALARVSEARGTEVPDTPEQKIWLARLQHHLQKGA